MFRNLVLSGSYFIAFCECPCPVVFHQLEKSAEEITEQIRNVAKQTPTRTPKSIKNHSKSVLGAMLAQDDTSLEPSWPKMSPRIDFSSIFGPFWGSKMHKKSIQKPSNFQTSLETLFSANRVHKSSKMRVQNHSKIEPFLGRVKNRESCSRLHADLVFEV